jgi:hypothetical protein
MKTKKHGNRLTNDVVIQQLKLKNINGYDYSKVEYHGDNVNITITCPIHGDFEQTPSNHKRGQKCPKCAGRGLSTSEHISIFKTIHGNKYDYNKTIVLNNTTKIIITCPTHGDFEQTPNAHKSGNGCKKCAGLEKPTQIELLSKFRLAHGDKYIYDKVNYISAHTKITITCPTHGDFEQTPNNHRIGHGCPTCKESRGESKIRQLLTNNRIAYLPQHKFSNCINQQQLPFDFYLPEKNICIEFNGIQHYKPVKHFGGLENLKKVKINDEIKKNYCLENNIKLVIIKYNDNIELKLINNI